MTTSHKSSSLVLRSIAFAGPPALIGIVYNYVDKHIKIHGKHSFLIPKMCSMKNAFAITNMTHETYMVDKVINEVIHGMFVKYIGNGSMKPYEFLNDATAY